MTGVVFSSKGFLAEEIAAKQFGGELVSDLEEQYKDIDLIIPSSVGNLTVSVKDQSYSTKRGYATVQMELVLRDTDTLEEMQGCFLSNRSDYYFWRVWYGGEDIWVIVKSEVLKTYVKENIDNLTQWNTTSNTNAKNREFGRKFNSSSGVVVGIEELISLGTTREVLITPLHKLKEAE